MLCAANLSEENSPFTLSIISSQQMAFWQDWFDLIFPKRRWREQMTSEGLPVHIVPPPAPTHTPPPILFLSQSLTTSLSVHQLLKGFSSPLITLHAAEGILPKEHMHAYINICAHTRTYTYTGSHARTQYPIPCGIQYVTNIFYHWESEWIWKKRGENFWEEKLFMLLYLSCILSFSFSLLYRVTSFFYSNDPCTVETKGPHVSSSSLI